MGTSYGILKCSVSSYNVSWKNQKDYSEQELRGMAQFTHYIWWKTPEETLQFPDRLVAQVMNIGIYEDVCHLVALIGEEKMRHVLEKAEIGQFSKRSWAYWHYRLTDIKLGEVPPMPKRIYHDSLPSQA